jgi:protein-tyrosine phosphatase
MSYRTELHFHLLPGVDDGPRDMADTLELARMAVQDGTRTITATPHVRDVVLAEIPDRVAEVSAAVRAAGIPLTVEAGAELAHPDLPDLSDTDLQAIAHGPAARRWVLLEAPLFGGDVDGLRAALAEVRDRGFGVLLGHPERCAPLMESDGALDAELAAGVHAQVNASSLLGRHGDDARDWGLGLVRSGRAHVLASDAHRPTRGPVLSEAVAVLASAGVDPAHAERLVADHPRALLEQGMPARGRSRAASAAA